MSSLKIVSYLTRRHVAKTGDIKDFVVIEESGIAKGIRRITAVTGQEAQTAIRLVESFTARIKQLDSYNRKEKDLGLKTLSIVRLPLSTGMHITYFSFRN